MKNLTKPTELRGPKPDIQGICNRLQPQLRDFSKNNLEVVWCETLCHHTLFFSSMHPVGPIRNQRSASNQSVSYAASFFLQQKTTEL
jgi:hypothetical protein